MLLGQGILLGIVLTLSTAWGWIVFVLILGAYLLANLTASICIARRKGLRVLPLLPITFAILHFSYGLGFLVGLFRFIHRWGDKEGKVPSLQRIHV